MHEQQTAQAAVGTFSATSGTLHSNQTEEAVVKKNLLHRAPRMLMVVQAERRERKWALMTSVHAMLQHGMTPGCVERSQ